MKKRKQLYIAYGSNLNTEQMQWRCPGARPIAKSWLHDCRLVFQGRKYGSHANVIHEKGKEVPVVVWEIDERNEAMLDRYEGVAGGYYTKEYMEVEVAGRMKKALIYIMTPNDYGIPADGYVETIMEGYRDFNFPIYTLNEALIYSYDQVKQTLKAE